MVVSTVVTDYNVHEEISRQTNKLQMRNFQWWNNVSQSL